MVKNLNEMYNRLDRIPACDRRTDILSQHSPRYAYALPGKNLTPKKNPEVLCDGALSLHFHHKRWCLSECVCRYSLAPEVRGPHDVGDFCYWQCSFGIPPVVFRPTTFNYHIYEPTNAGTVAASDQ